MEQHGMAARNKTTLQPSYDGWRLVHGRHCYLQDVTRVTL